MSRPAQTPTHAWTIRDKVRVLSDPQTYPHGPEDVQVTETHMAWVFLAGELVFKLKKPVTYDFLDFGTLEKRKTAVHDEVRLNRRLAWDVYHDPRPLIEGRDGRLALDGAGPVVDWLVVMRRLAEDRDLETVIADDRLRPDHLAGVADRLSAFYQGLPAEDIAPQDFADGFEQEHRRTASVLTDPELALDGEYLDAAITNFEARLEAVRPALLRRAEKGRIVEGHGDLRPEHVFLCDPPLIIDCLEFNRRLRLVDPFDEIAFLGMEAAALGAETVFATLTTRLMDALYDRPSAELMAFYWSYRALLHARLALLHLAEPDPRTPEKWRPKAWRYIRLAESADLMTRLPEGR